MGISWAESIPKSSLNSARKEVGVSAIRSTIKTGVALACEPVAAKENIEWGNINLIEALKLSRWCSPKPIHIIDV
jgi:hypothetical protein